jgi:P-type Mg2+ transporter
MPSHPRGGEGQLAYRMEGGLSASARIPGSAVLEALGSSDQGLSSAEAADRLRTLGANVLREHRVTAVGVLARQFRNPLLLLLLLCAAVSGFTGDPTDAAIIAAIVAVSVLLSFVNEYRAESAVEALHQEIHHRALVRRDGRDQLVDNVAIVPGDIVTLAVGNVVPADLRLLGRALACWRWQPGQCRMQQSREATSASSRSSDS